MEPVVVINLYLRNAYWRLHILLNSALLNGHIVCKQYQDSWPTKYGILTGYNAYIESEIFTVQFSQAVQCIAAKKQSFLCHAQEERSGIQSSELYQQWFLSKAEEADSKDVWEVEFEEFHKFFFLLLST